MPTPPAMAEPPIPGGLSGGRAPNETSSSGSGPARLRGLLTGEEALHGAFARYLCFRADLLRPDYLDALRPVREVAPPMSMEDSAAAVRAASPEGSALAASMKPGCLWSTVSRCAWLAEWKGRAVVVQVARPPAAQAALDAFDSWARRTLDGEFPALVRPGTLRQFREWLRFTESPERERSYLRALATMSGRTGVDYPAPCDEVSSGPVLVWPWVEGETAAAGLERKDAETVVRLSEMVLEQICVLSLVDADLDPGQVVVAGGRLTVRRANRLVAIPAPRARSALRYVSALLSGNSPMAARALLKLAWGRVEPERESRLLAELSTLAPELKGDRRFATAGTMVECNSRALAVVNGGVPLFLESMHRNLLAAAYWNAECSPQHDSVTEAQWPVLGRLLRFRVGNLLDRDVASEWLVGSGLLVFESLRQMNRLADEFRENELSVGVDSSSTGETGERNANRAAGVWILAGVFFVTFAVAVRWAGVLPPPYSAVGTVAAAVGAAGLFWAVSRIG